MITLKSCLNCAGVNIVQYHRPGFAPHVTHEIMPGVHVNAAIVARYFVCQNCSLIFQNPRLSDEELDRFYSEGYYRRTMNATDDEVDKDEAGRAKVDSELIKKHIGKVGSHLDIGCSRGYFLEEVDAKTKVGVESNVGYVTAKGVEVYHEVSQVPQKKFDLTTAIHVLEHVSDPFGLLKRMIALTSKNGHVVIEVPTWKSKGGPLRLPHLYHFEPDVLRLICARLGLNVVGVEFTPHLVLVCKPI